MNPPYGRETGYWIEKAYRESLNGAIVVCLVPARPDTRWWQEIILPYAASIQFVSKRLRFSGSKIPAPFPSAIVVFDKKSQGAYWDMTFDMKGEEND